MENVKNAIEDSVKQYINEYHTASDQARKVMGIWQVWEVVRKHEFDRTQKTVSEQLFTALRNWKEVRADIAHEAQNEVIKLNRLTEYMGDLKAAHSAYLGSSRLEEYIAKEKQIMLQVQNVAHIIDLDGDVVHALFQIANSEVFAK